MTAAKNPEIPAEITIHTEAEDIIIPPSDLWSDEPSLESDLHRDQIELLLACLKWWWRNRTDFYATGNLTIYYSPEQITTREFRGPDFFVVLGCENRPRKSWVLWAEQGKYPNVIIELLSNSTAKVDKGLKFELYQETFRTPEYFWFHPNTLEFKGFRLVGGKYQPLEANADGWLWSQQLELFLGVYESKLRFFNADKQLVATPEERAQAAEREAETAHQQVEELKAKLKALGVDTDRLES
ncbi:Uma2 family endonuclease [Desmonostoc muscorum LEGE 12446]|uniref:Uma2 family endonuclease n=1 Tax=Desmonostoc muscorum LEGE 12446 TaxID=1828758 RepID=A0A8J6ZJS6_DESMC|nr:Uma2 family endonuclease [Desmonostoc muscorum]MCF2148263.1 Uma2 family endonuclease [Desmonostoc muscorum LEGE 12446]